MKHFVIYLTNDNRIVFMGANKTTCLTTQVYKMFGKFADKPTVLQLFEI